MKLSHINHDEKIYTAVFLNFILTSRIKVCKFFLKKNFILIVLRNIHTKIPFYTFSFYRKDIPQK